jgi:hypothetical protein
MRFRRIVFVSGLALAAVVPACGGGSLQHDGGGGHDGASACENLDESDCRARTDCTVGTCAQCSGGQAFAGCYDSAHPSPPACLAIPCPSGCATLDETSCRARTDCQAVTCNPCGTGSYFAACIVAGANNIGCPAVSCPISCAQIADQATCDASGICHSVFTNSGACDCAPAGCCTHYSGCADGAKATCAPPSTLACKSLAPDCEGPYVLSYTSTCYEGCVLSSECGL